MVLFGHDAATQGRCSNPRPRVRKSPRRARLRRERLIGEWFNGRTIGSDPVSPGSNPGSPAILHKSPD
jgi:hypothetical protein